MNTTVKVISGEGFAPAEIQFGMKWARENGLKPAPGCYEWNDLRQFESLPPAMRIHSTHCDHCRNMIAMMRRMRTAHRQETTVMIRKKTSLWGWFLKNLFGSSR
ncbi:MAG: hypothetical protein G01um101419_713 [Parcubacteria group bacterium Gr01-1014_19]|nr:MAG: hypothetical protein G01um101419_713 [Parcubacteria group bacterium Gr01-1014_19]